MKMFSFIKKGKLNNEKKSILIFLSSVFSILFIWLMFTINFVFEGYNEIFLTFNIILSSFLLACILYSVKLALGEKKWKKR